jgi:DNA-directed RNA polymerase subunit beta'
MEQIRLTPASSDDIRRRSSGAVTRHDIFDPHTKRPHTHGVCCEMLFGREGDWECACGRLRGTQDIGYICIRCDAPVVHLRSTRWGHVELVSPVVNPLFVPALAAILDYTPAALRQVVRSQAFVVLEPGLSAYSTGDSIHSDEYYYRPWGDAGPDFEIETGAEAVRKLLSRIDVSALRDGLSLDPSQRRRFRVIDRICRAAPDDPNGYAARMLLDCIPVLPPAHRLLRSQGGDSFGESLSTAYARIIARNNRLRTLMGLSAPEVIIHNERRMLQAQVEILFENTPQRRQGWICHDPKAKSLADRLRGPTRDRLLSRRVDYSASGVLVPDSGLPLDAVAIPMSVALELFRTHLLIRLSWSPRARRLLDLLHPRARGGLDESHLAGLRLYREMIANLGDRLTPLVEEVMSEHRLVLSVHDDRTGPLVALRPVLGEDSVIAIHGETMRGIDAKPGMQARLHLPLSAKAREEAKSLLGVERNLVRGEAESARKDAPHRSDPEGWFRSAQATRCDVRIAREEAERRRAETRRAKYGDGLFAELLLGDPVRTLVKYAAKGRAVPADDFLARWMRGVIVPPEEG